MMNIQTTLTEKVLPDAWLPGVDIQRIKIVGHWHLWDKFGADRTIAPPDDAIALVTDGLGPGHRLMLDIEHLPFFENDGSPNELTISIFQNIAARVRKATKAQFGFYGLLGAHKWPSKMYARAATDEPGGWWEQEVWDDALDARCNALRLNARLIEVLDPNVGIWWPSCYANSKHIDVWREYRTSPLLHAHALTNKPIVPLLWHRDTRNQWTPHDEPTWRMMLHTMQTLVNQGVAQTFGIWANEHGMINKGWSSLLPKRDDMWLRVLREHAPTPTPGSPAPGSNTEAAVEDSANEDAAATERPRRRQRR